MTFAATILSTKIVKPGLADKAMAFGIEIIEKSFIKTETIDFVFTEKQNVDCYVFTSMNAVKAVLNANVNLKSKTIASTSGETKKLLNNNSIVVDFESHDAKSLANKLIEANIQSVAFFCGNIHREELPQILRAANTKVEEVVVYKTILTPVVVKESFDGVLFFSPSAVDSFLQDNHIADNTTCFCIGQTTADHLFSKTKAKIQISTSPSQEKLIDQLIHYYTN